MSAIIARAREHLFWVLAGLTFVTLVYSTGLHQLYGPEATISPRWFFEPPNEVRGGLAPYYDDLGILADRRPRYEGADAWKLGATPTDSAFYLLQSEDLSRSIAPYRYRVLVPWLAGVLADATGIATPVAFVVLNVLSIVAAALLFCRYLMTQFELEPTLSFLGGCLFVSMVSNTRTVALPMVDPPSMLFCMLSFMAATRRWTVVFVVATICGVLTKEVLVAFGILWLVHRCEDQPRPTVLDVGVALVPVAAFALVRMALGGAPLEVNYGYDPLQGDLPEYWQRLTTPRGLVSLSVKAFLSFGFVWLGLVNVRRFRWLRRQALLVPVVLLAAFVLSGQIARVIGVLFPIVIPAFLLWVDDAVRAWHVRTILAEKRPVTAKPGARGTPTR